MTNKFSHALAMKRGFNLKPAIIRSILSTKISDIRRSHTMEDAEKFKYKIDTSAYTIVDEGKAKILIPNSHDVFYNPVQEFNRDISIAVISEFAKRHYQSVRNCNRRNLETTNLETTNTEQHAVLDESSTDESHFEIDVNQSNPSNDQPHSPIDEEIDKDNLPAGKICEDGIEILEALAASGLRSIRYALEVPGIKSIVANDLVPQAVESIERNVNFNEVDHLVTSNKDDAVTLMNKHRRENKFHVVDLDPYGSPAQFLDAAVQCVSDGGLLLVTCTDVATLCGNSPETCFAKYGSISLKTKSCHEMALRIILYSIQSNAARYGRFIVPMLSLSADFYIRVFVQVFTSAATAKHFASKSAMVYQCVGCESLTLQRLMNVTPHENGRNFRFTPSTGPTVNPSCSNCGRKYKIGGPIWADPIHDQDFVRNVLTSVEQNSTNFKTSKRLMGVMNVILEELPTTPLFYLIDSLFSTVHLTPPKMKVFRSAILNAGYSVSLSHTCKGSVKTDAPNDVVWDIIRAWAKQTPPGKKAHEDNNPAKQILSKEPKLEVSFEEHPMANPESREKRLVRFQHNPEPNWGPKMKSRTSLRTDTEQSKQMRKQGKRSRDLDSRNLKQYPCKRFKEGKCELGDACKYMHCLQKFSNQNK